MAMAMAQPETAAVALRRTAGEARPQEGRKENGAAAKTARPQEERDRKNCVKAAQTQT